MVGVEGFVAVEPAHDVVKGEFIVVVPLGFVRIVESGIKSGHGHCLSWLSW
ncbi:MAG: hypothetical protein VCE74_02415 [Alphaproteobacteria bacterium]